MNNLEEDIESLEISSNVESAELSPTNDIYGGVGVSPTNDIYGGVGVPPTNDEVALYFLNTCGIQCSSMIGLSGIVIYRDVLLCDNTYEKLKKDIPKLKPLLSSTTYTSMQKDAYKSQQWPLINLIRQILRKYNYQLVPKRVCDGYTKDGIKKYKRLFEVRGNPPYEPPEI